MQIDWFTVIAQIINFIVLMWLLKRFLYKPILNAIDMREQNIAKQFSDAMKKKCEVEKELRNFQKKNEAFDHHKEKMLDDVTKEIEETRNTLLEKAKADADAVIAKKRQAWENEAENLTNNIIQRTKDTIFTLTTQTLHDLADISLEAHICDMFITYFQKLKITDKQLLSLLGHKPIIIQSAFELSSTQQKKIQEAIEKKFDIPINNLSFKIKSELISGIELSINGHKIAWNVKDYLIDLETPKSEIKVLSDAL